MKPANGKAAALSFFFGGLLPVIAFTVIEEKYGIVAGLIAGMVFGFGEIIYELIRHRKVSTMTWVGNGLLLVLGGVSLISSEGIWFKLQPALMEGLFAFAMWGSYLIKKPLLVVLAEKQGHQLPEVVKTKLAGVTWRTGFFFAIHTGLAVWAAYDWSTTNWALLKGIGLTVTFIIYLLIEVFYLRQSVAKMRE
ncbi:inner membrane-spanning protein YciB [Bdellovibrio sp. HCB337]|uniref:inner membrane-spanning protein YciB n=1 Tax=Bdellovibrio sp. HCB337 TaxID=3394358 RepID=UPI0039A65A6F